MVLNTRTTKKKEGTEELGAQPPVALSFISNIHFPTNSNKYIKSIKKKKKGEEWKKKKEEEEKCTEK